MKQFVASPLAPLQGGHDVPPLWRRGLRFGAVGASGVVVNAVLLVFLVEIMDAKPLVAAPFAIEAAVFTNFLLNRNWTWRERPREAATLWRYHAVAFVGMAIQWLALFVAVGAGLHYLAGLLLGVAAATLWNFIGADRFAFPAQAPTRRWPLYVGSLLLQLVMAAVLTHTWDTFVFQKSVSDFLLNGITPYQTAIVGPDYIYPGSSLPLLAQWYAYPPLPLLLFSLSYFPAAFGSAAPWVGRLLIKLPVILGNLAFAWAAHRLIATAPGAEPLAAARAARRVERWILWNPLFIVIATIWGQFEAILLVALILMVLALRTGRSTLAGAWWGAALLLKIFPLFLVPVLGVHLFRRGGTKAVTRFFAAGFGLFAIVSLPFFLLEPQGFLQQVLFMHAERPPARFSPVAALYLLTRSVLGALGVTASTDALAQGFSGFSFALTGVILVAIAFAASHRPATERQLVTWMGLTFLAGLLCTKVLNEQYAILPLGLLAIAQWHPEPSSRRSWGAVLFTGSWTIGLAGLLENFHFLTFIPDDVARAVFQRPVQEVIVHLVWSLGLTVAQAKTMLAASAAILLAFPLATSVWALRGPVREGLIALERSLEQALHRVRVPAAPRAIVAGAILFSLLVLPGVAGVLTTSTTADHMPSEELPPRAVLAEYRTNWYNPDNDPAVAGGSWGGVGLAPLDGYYNTNARKVTQDLATLRRLDVDGILLDTDPYFQSGASTAWRMAEARGTPHALRVDVARFADESGRVPLEPVSATRVRDLASGPASGYWDSQHILRRDGSHLLFVAGVDQLGYTFSPGELAFVLSKVPAGGPLPELAAAKATPTDLADLHADTAAARAWRSAYDDAFASWWQTALSGVRGARPVSLVSDRPILLPDASTIAWAGDLAVQEPAALDSSDRLRFASLGGPLTPDSYRPEWKKVEWTQPDAVIVPWNDFAATRAIEPSQQHGDRILRETATWVRAFHRGPEPEAAQDETPAPPSDWPLPIEPPIGPQTDPLADLLLRRP